MWVHCNDAFVSIVAHRDDPSVMLVRGRFAGDVARFLGRSVVEEVEMAQADYRYRIQCSRQDVARAMLRAVAAVEYPNFKDSIKASWRAQVAMSIWSILRRAQDERAPLRANQIPGWMFRR